MATLRAVECGGLELINGKGPPDNKAYVMQQNMKIDQPVDLRVQVRKSGIRVERDGQSFLEWNGNPSQLSLGTMWDDKGSPRLFLGAQATFVIHRLEFVPLTKVDSQSQWIDLFNGKDLSGWKEMGVKYWSVSNGEIAAPAASLGWWHRRPRRRLRPISGIARESSCKASKSRSRSTASTS